MSQRLSLQAVFLCKSTDFQLFAAKRMQPGAVPSEAKARSYLLHMCSIKSRAELDTNALAAERFHDVRSRYRQSLAGTTA